MADTPDIWPGRWPDPPPRAPSSALTPVRPIGDRVPRFGVAQELDTPGWDTGNGGRRGPPGVPAPTGRRRRTAGNLTTASADGTWARLRTWWACREVHPVDVWHRVQCHFGRHRIEGGQRIQLGGRFVNTERCCVWCRSKP
jgi:hypothetical protein